MAQLRSYVHDQEVPSTTSASLASTGYLGHGQNNTGNGLQFAIVPELPCFSCTGPSLPRLPIRAWSGNAFVYSIPGILCTSTVYYHGCTLNILSCFPVTVVIPGYEGRSMVGILTYFTPFFLSLIREFPRSLRQSCLVSL